MLSEATTHGGLSVTQMRAEVAHERINPDAFDWLAIQMPCVELAATLRFSEAAPVGGLITGSTEAKILDEGFQQYRAIRVARVPVLGQASADQREGARGEVATLDPRQDQEAGVIDDEVHERHRGDATVSRPRRLGLAGRPQGLQARQPPQLAKGPGE
jgi:hypothetical protein